MCQYNYAPRGYCLGTALLKRQRKASTTALTIVTQCTEQCRISKEAKQSEEHGRKKKILLTNKAKMTAFQFFSYRWQTHIFFLTQYSVQTNLHYLRYIPTSEERSRGILVDKANCVALQSALICISYNSLCHTQGNNYSFDHARLKLFW